MADYYYEITSISDIVVDDNYATFSMNVTPNSLPGSLTVELSVIHLGMELFLGNVYVNNGTITRQVAASDLYNIVQRSPNNTQMTVSVKIKTINARTQTVVGTSEVYATMVISETPGFSGSSFTYLDTNSTVVSKTGSNQVLLQEASTPRITLPTATTKNGATITQYAVRLNDTISTSSTNVVNCGGVNVSGNVAVEAKATDSRGYDTGWLTLGTVPVTAYKSPVISSYNANRPNSDTQVNYSFSGSYTPVTINGSTINSIKIYRDSTNITSQCTINGSNFSYSGTQTVALDTSVTLTIRADDGLVSKSISLVLPKYLPLVKFRNRTNTPGEMYIAGQIFTSYKDSVAMGSYEAMKGAASADKTLPNLCNELRFSSGCMGSVNLSSSYTRDGIEVPSGWHNFIYSPHRNGGRNGEENANNTDNDDYGTLLLLTRMDGTVGQKTQLFKIRITSASSSDYMREIRRILTDADFASLPEESSVTGSGLVSSWKILKWPNGRCEAEAVTDSTGYPMTSSYGNAWYYAVSNQALPSNVFTSVEYAQVNRCGGGTSGLMYATIYELSNTAIKWEVVSPASETRNASFAIRVVGRWK